MIINFSNVTIQNINNNYKIFIRLILNNDFEKKIRICKFQNNNIKFRNFDINKNFDIKQKNNKRHII